MQLNENRSDHSDSISDDNPLCYDQSRFSFGCVIRFQNVSPNLTLYNMFSENL